VETTAHGSGPGLCSPQTGDNFNGTRFHSDFQTRYKLLIFIQGICSFKINTSTLKQCFMGTVNSILKTKSNITFSITPETTVYNALEIMVEKNVSALLVVENEKLVGIFTERDYARKVILQGKASKETMIGEIMTEYPITVSPETSIDDCMRLMTNKFIRHLPVVKNDELIGIISIGDVVKNIIEDQKFIIENMEHYITGT
jgi:CBS domain-containing protein